MGTAQCPFCRAAVNDVVICPADITGNEELIGRRLKFSGVDLWERGVGGSRQGWLDGYMLRDRELN